MIIDNYSKHLLQPITKKVRVKRFIAFDIETITKKNKFLIGCIYMLNYDGTPLKRVFYNCESMRNYLLNLSRDHKRDSVIVAHNLSFDFNILYDPLDNSINFKKFNSGSTLVFAHDKLNGLVYYDSLAIFRMGLEKVGKIIGIPKMQQPKYIKENRLPSKEEIPYIIDYCMNDCYVTHQAMLHAQQIMNSMGTELKCTIASNALNLFRTKHMDQPMLQPPLYVMNEIREGYYGGRTEVFKRGTIRVPGKRIYKYDYNSCYAAMYLKLFPDSLTIKRSGILDKPSLDLLKYEGVSLCSVQTPINISIPLLPQRNNNKLTFPIGKWKGSYTHIELRKAIELGYKIKLIRSIYYEKSYYPFKDYAETLYPLRLQYQKDKNLVMAMMLKSLLTNLYGKFGMKNEYREVMHINDMKQSDYANAEYVDINHFSVLRKMNFIARYVNPIYAAYITAYARLKLYEDFERIGFNNVFYCDTDSIMTDKIIETSDQLGELKLEDVIKDLIIIRPKLYYQDGKIVSKGLHLDTDADHKQIFKDILSGKAIKQTRLIKTKTYMKYAKKYAINEQIEFEKRFNLEDDKRIWLSKFDGYHMQESKPLTVRM
jgi:hypothetical protein